MNKLLPFVFLLFSFLSLSQTQIGQDIDGEAADDRSGIVSISSNGTVVAIGAPYNGGNGSNSGHVRVYQYQAGSWSQVGADIDGGGNGEESGYSVSLSADGNTIAIGAPKTDSGRVRVYQYQSGSWTQIGGDINGEAVGDQSGFSVSLSSDGSIVAIGAPYNDDGMAFSSGQVRVYQNQSGTWSQLGGDMDGVGADDRLGWSISLSSDGSRVAMGAPFSGGAMDASGYVRVYEYQTNTWVQLGGDIDGEAIGDNSGQSVSLSSDGSVVAIGAPLNDGAGSNSGHVRVYQYQSSSWSQVGVDINGVAGDGFGWSVSISSDGSGLASGTSFANKVRAYKYQSSSWSQVGADIDGESPSDFSGWSISLSSDGNKVAIGALSNAGNGFDSGHVRVYDLSGLLSIEDSAIAKLILFPNPTKNGFNVQLTNGLELNNINIYNQFGQLVGSAKSKAVKTNTLSSGIYYVEIETNLGKAAKKIVIN